MSLPMDSPYNNDRFNVCQIPDCTTTRAEIEFELKTFLSSYCTVCKQDRNGKLCGCAFPCSLTFRAHMLNKIHDLLGIEKPHNRKAIQVCFKHPDLLKQAREACVAKRRELCTAARARRFDRSEVGVLTTSLPEVMKSSVEVLTASLPEEMTPSNGTFTKLLPDNVSSPIGALTTSLPGVVTSPIGAVSNPPLSVTDAEDERSKIPFGSMMNIEEDYRQQLGPSTSAAAAQSEVSFENQNDDDEEEESQEDSEFEEFEDFARRKFAEMERKNKDAEIAKPSPIKMTKILFNLGTDTSDDDDDEFGGDMESDEVRSIENGETRAAESVELENSRSDDLERDPSAFSVSDEDDIAEKSDLATSEPNISCRKRPNQKMFCIKYQNYHDSILMQELGSLLHKSFLNDVQFVCRDGQVCSSSLLLGSMSTFLRDVLSDVPIVDKMKVIIVPDVTTSELETFLGLIFADQKTLTSISEKDARKIQTFASMFAISSISVAQKRRGRPRGSTKKRPQAQTSESRTDLDRLGLANNHAKTSVTRTDLDRLGLANNKAQTSHTRMVSDRLELVNSQTKTFDNISQLGRLEVAANEQPQSRASDQISLPRSDSDRFEVSTQVKRMRPNPEPVQGRDENRTTVIVEPNQLSSDICSSNKNEVFMSSSQVRPYQRRSFEGEAVRNLKNPE